MNEIINDPRFANIARDPRYRNASIFQRKVKLDERFNAVLQNELFSEKGSMDPRGRPRNFGTKEDYNRFYKLTSNEDIRDKKNERLKGKLAKQNEALLGFPKGTKKNKNIKECKLNKERNKQKNNMKCKNKEKKSNLTETLSDAAKETSDKDFISEDFLPGLLDMTRGENLFSDDSSDDDSSTTTDEGDDLWEEFEWGELDHDAQWDCGTAVEETNRFAVCNMDWDQVKASDLMVLFASFVPPEGKIQKISVYLSEYGKKRLEEEEKQGPSELVTFSASNMDASSDFNHLERVTKGTLNETDQPSPCYNEALRRYQRNRLKYYYAVVECDSVNTAKSIYKECDQTPFEAAGVTLDLRYIPSDMEFINEVVHDSCENVPENYSSEIIKSATLMNSNPKLTWDETDNARRKILSTVMSKALQKANYDLGKLKAYIASSSSDDDGEDIDENFTQESKVEKINKFRSLMLELEEKSQKKQEIEVDKEEDFILGEEKGSKGEEVEEKEEGGVTPFEKYLVKRQKKKRNAKKKEDNTAFSDELPEGVSDLVDDHKKKGKRGKKRTTRVEESPHHIPDGSLELMVMDEAREDSKHFSMRRVVEEEKVRDSKKKKKDKMRKRKCRENLDEGAEDGDFKIDLDDRRFAAVAASSHFNIDPSHPRYIQTKAMEKLAEEVQKKRINFHRPQPPENFEDNSPDDAVSLK